MNMKRQSGVALVQVLLICSLLLLLVVQLSKSARESVRIATELKQKVGFVVNAESAIATASFELLTQPPSFELNWQNKGAVNFSGERLLINTDVTVELQDVSGLLSSSFIGVEWEAFVGEDQDKLFKLRQWQGMGETLVAKDGYRNARIPYLEEINLLEGWGDTDLTYITDIPSGFFNAATAPSPLLRQIYNEAIVSQIIQLRENKEVTRDNMLRIAGIDESSAFFPGEYTRVTVTGLGRRENEDLYSRSKLFHMQTGKDVPILEIGLGML